MVKSALLLAVLCRPTSQTLRAEDMPAAEFEKRASELRTKTLEGISPKVTAPNTAPTTAHSISGRYPWHSNIGTTIFWIVEGRSKSSAWDPDWAYSYGGFDNPNPASRRDFMPAAFIPKENPFYFALPYNDLEKGRHKPEAHLVIPWFDHAFERQGKSVCQNRWIAIRKGNRVCYAQWSDVGPFRSDHWKYVFGNESPKPNLEHGAGLNVSPAVRDFLGLGNADVTDWRFVESRDVPNGPWARIGGNNTVAQRYTRDPSATPNPFPTDPKPTPTGPPDSSSPHTPPPTDTPRK